MATSLEELEKDVRMKKIHANTFHGIKIVKIGLVDAEIYLFDLKKRNYRR